MGNEKKGGAYYDSLRHEDLMHLSFDECGFVVVLSFAVLEHIPDTEESTVKIFRYLKLVGF